ncbi:MAG: hypothetical protein ACKV19_11720 [Verrucomicrobiales bacterium]
MASTSPLHPVFRLAPCDPPANGEWVAIVGCGDPSACRHWRVSSRNLTGGGGILVGDFMSVLHRLRHWSRGRAFTVEVEPQVAKALRVPSRQTFAAEVMHPRVPVGHRPAPAH